MQLSPELLGKVRRLYRTKCEAAVEVTQALREACEQLEIPEDLYGVVYDVVIEGKPLHQAQPKEVREIDVFPPPAKKPPWWIERD